MKIVVLDGYAANPGDLSWEGLKTLGECTIYDRTAPEEVLERAAGAEAILTNKVVITAEQMTALPDLKYIGVLATGYNIIDINAARERGIVVTNIPAYSTPSVGQMVFAHILNITSKCSIILRRYAKAGGRIMRTSVFGILRSSNCLEKRSASSVWDRQAITPPASLSASV